MGITNKQKVGLLRKIVEIRMFEEKAVDLMYSGKMPGWLHIAIGEEAMCAGLSEAMAPQDKISLHHRSHGHCVAKGLDLKKLMAELFGKSTGYCKGKGGSMHMADFDSNMLGAQGIVGGGISISLGAALADMLRKSDGVTVSCFGDGASNQGVLYESMNLAAIWKLPIVFFCENNLYGMTVPQSYHQAIKDIAKRAQGFGMPGTIADGMDPEDTYHKSKEAIERARAGEGPAFIEAKTYRYKGHWEGDPCEAMYRPEGEMEEWKKKDPLDVYKKKLLKGGVITQKEIDSIEKQTIVKIADAVEFALSSPEPEFEDALNDVYTV
jgi:TPP-dependent pyruvate/acetoin dehydrogenase alpha subunit